MELRHRAMDMLYGIAILYVLATAHATVDGGIKLSDENRLVRDILTRYKELGTIARPRHNSSHPVLLKFGLRLITLDVDEKKQTLKTSVWLRHLWYDDHLQWNPDEYGGIRYIILPHKSVWMPEDVALVNTAEADLDERTVDLQVKHTGRVFYVPHVVYESGCLIDLTNYPYDIQTCDLWIQSVSRYSWDLRLVPYEPSPLDLDTYLGSFKEAKDWDVIGNSTQFVDTPRDHGAILMYSRRGALKFSLVLRRRLGFMSLLLMLPCVFLAMMISVIFCLPTERPDRHMLAMSLFASFMVLLLILTENAPPSAASVPKLGMYYCFNMLLIITAIFVSVFVIFVSRQAESKRYPPRWMALVFLRYLAVPLCLRDKASFVTHYDQQKTTSHQSNNSGDQTSSQTTSHCHRNGTGDDSTLLKAEQGHMEPSHLEPNHLEPNHLEPSHFPKPRKSAARPENNGGTDVGTVAISVPEERVARVGRPPVPSQGPFTPAHMQWRVITLVLDRMFALLFLLANISAIIFLLPMPSPAWLNKDPQ